MIYYIIYIFLTRSSLIFNSCKEIQMEVQKDKNAKLNLNKTNLIRNMHLLHQLEYTILKPYYNP